MGKNSISKILLAIVSISTALSVDAETTNKRPNLVIGVTIDGLSMDYIDLLRDKFVENGFNYFLNNGVTLTEIDFGTPLDAAAATAVIYTGAAPTINGVSSAKVFDYGSRKMVPLLNSEKPTPNDTYFSPRKLLASTITDELRIDGGGNTQAHSLGPDASMAVIGGGHTANSVYWINDASGMWTTSTFFQERPPYVSQRNKEQPLSAKLDTLVWSPLFKTTYYPDLNSTRQENPFSTRYPYGTPERYARFKASPKVNTETTDLAIDFLKNQQLGTHGEPDMLSIVYTVQPYPFGSDADDKLETMDGYLRTDRELDRLLKAVNDGPGLENTLIFISGTPVAPRSRKEDVKWRIPGGDFSPKKAESLLNLYLINKFGNADWIAGFDNGYFYLNQDALISYGVDPRTVREEAASFLRRMEGVAYAYTIEDITERKVHDNADAVARNTRIDVVGDVFITVAPGWHVVDETKQVEAYKMVERAASTTAPAFIVYPGIKPQTINEKLDARIIAPTVSSLLRIRAPNGASLAPLRFNRDK